MALMGGIQGRAGLILRIGAHVGVAGDWQPDAGGVVAGLYPARKRDAAAGGSAATRRFLDSGKSESIKSCFRISLTKLTGDAAQPAPDCAHHVGMAWGIATVVMLLAYGDGFGKACANIFANFGNKLVIVVPGRTSTQAGGKKAECCAVHAG